MPITDPGAIQYSNEYVRVAADKMVRTYRKLKLLNQHWTSAAGTNEEKWTSFKASIIEVSDYVIDAYYVIYRANRQWFSLGMNSLFPNDPLQLVFDGGQYDGQDPYRPLINGQDVQRLQAIWRSWLTWLEKNSFDVNTANPLDWATHDAFSKLTRDGLKAPTQGQGVNVATTLASQIITQYEVTSPVTLTRILAVAVNP